MRSEMERSVREWALLRVPDRYQIVTSRKVRYKQAIASDEKRVSTGLFVCTERRP